MLDNLADLSIRYNDHDDENTKYPGAYKTGTEVLALMRDNIEWRIAEIYEIRPAKFYKETVSDKEIEDKELFDDILVQNQPMTNTF